MPPRSRLPLLAAAVTLLAACASASRHPADASAEDAGVAQAGSASSRRCVPATVDSSFAAFGAVHRNCDVDRPARLRAQPQPDRTEITATTASRRPQNQCHTAVAEFVIDETGHPIVASARIVRSNSMEAAKTVMRMVSALRYEPAMKDGQPVRQVASYGWGTAAVVRSGPSPGRPPRC